MLDRNSKFDENDYPQSARSAKIEGRAIVSMVINETGQVSQATISKSTGNEELDRAALVRASKMTFSPGKVAGAAVCAKKDLAVSFKLEGDAQLSGLTLSR